MLLSWPHEFDDCWFAARPAYPMKPTAKGALWAAGAAFGISWMPVFSIYSHVSDDPFVWRFWALVSQMLTLALMLLVVPDRRRSWVPRLGELMRYWGSDGEPLRIRNRGGFVRSPLLWASVGLTLDLAFWVWATTLIDPLIAALILQLSLIGTVMMAARLGKRVSAGGRPSHAISRKHGALMAVSFLGAGLAIWSETGEVGTLNWPGVVVALAAAGFSTGAGWGTISLGRLLTWPDSNPNELVRNALLAAMTSRTLALPLTLSGSLLFFPPTDKTFWLYRGIGLGRTTQRGGGGRLRVLLVHHVQPGDPENHALHAGPPDALAVGLH